MAEAFDDFYKWVGLCITEWAHAEDYLFLICRKCLRTRYDLASIVYYRIQSLDTRLNLVDELVCANLPERVRKSGGHDHPDLTQWKSIRTEISNLLGMRGRIAHNPMRADIDLTVPTGFNVRIEASFAERLRARSAGLEEIEEEDLVQHAIKVQAATKRLTAFYEKILPKHIG